MSCTYVFLERIKPKHRVVSLGACAVACACAGARSDIGEVPQREQGERAEEPGDRGFSQAQLQVPRRVPLKMIRDKCLLPGRRWIASK